MARERGGNLWVRRWPGSRAARSVTASSSSHLKSWSWLSFSQVFTIRENPPTEEEEGEEEGEEEKGNHVAQRRRKKKDGQQPCDSILLPQNDPSLSKLDKHHSDSHQTHYCTDKWIS